MAGSDQAKIGETTDQIAVKTAVLRMGIAAMRLCSSAEHVRSITAILLEGLHSDQIDFLRTAKNPPDF